uniref:F-box domain-containing protein n=1 Tax=Oryza glumipatula TaxID=40148 RepID=A0A0E0BLK7_9ORYZ
MAAGDDRLSALPDDLLIRVLHFAPAKEAASTSLLSRRFGALWRSSGAVNLAACVPDGRDAFVRAADAALAAADRAVTRLTLHVEGDDECSTYNSLRVGDHDVLDAVVAHPAARRVEELRVAAVHRGQPDEHDDAVMDDDVFLYILRFSSLPSNTLRVLDLTRCHKFSPPPPRTASSATAVAFPRLTTLRLRHCTYRVKHLHGIVDAAPELATVHLEFVLLTSDRHRRFGPVTWNTGLRFPAATALALIHCRGEEGAPGRSMEITAPRLRSFTYKGEAVRFDLTSPPSPPAPDTTTVVAADLHFTHGLGRCVDYSHFIHNFTNAKVLRLKANHLDDMAVAEVFPDLEHLRLELDGAYSGWSMATETAAETIAGLLHCCPVLRQLKLNFISDLPPDSCKNSKQVKHLCQKKCDADFEKSIDDFMRLIKFKSKQRLDIPGLSDCSFACLQNSLRRVGLQFRLGEDSDCFGVRLIKFFAENAMVLEELHVLTAETEISEST